MTLIYSWSVPSPEVRDLGPGVHPVRLCPSSMGAGLLLVVGVAAKQTVGVSELENCRCGTPRTSGVMGL